MQQEKDKAQTNSRQVRDRSRRRDSVGQCRDSIRTSAGHLGTPDRGHDRNQLTSGATGGQGCFLTCVFCVRTGVGSETSCHQLMGAGDMERAGG